MKLKETVFCKNISVYAGQLTKRKPYLIEDINTENVRINNDQGKLKWYSKHYFDSVKEAEILFINIDDKIKNSILDAIEVTIEYSDGNKYWTTFTTPEYLQQLLTYQQYIVAKFIIVKDLTEYQIYQTIFELDKQDELIDYCKKY